MTEKNKQELVKVPCLIRSVNHFVAKKSGQAWVKLLVTTFGSRERDNDMLFSEAQFQELGLDDSFVTNLLEMKLVPVFATCELRGFQLTPIKFDKEE